MGERGLRPGKEDPLCRRTWRAALHGARSLEGPRQPAQTDRRPVSEKTREASAVSTTSLGSLHESAGSGPLSNWGTLCASPHAVQPRGPSACRRPRNLDAPLPLLPQQEAIKEVKISHEEHAGPKRTGLGREQQIPSLPPGVRVPWAPPGFLTAHFPRVDKSGKPKTAPRTLVAQRCTDRVCRAQGRVLATLPCHSAWGL